jgi:hypothetical protein
VSDANKKIWLIWSNQHGAWWKANSYGYDNRVVNAGRFSRSEAQKICSDACYRNDWTIGESNLQSPHEVMVPSPEYLAELASIQRYCEEGERLLSLASVRDRAEVPPGGL